MFRDIFSSRAIFAGLFFFVLVVGGSLIYSWHVHRTTDAEVAETQRKVQPLENKNETRIAADTTDTSKVDFGTAETSIASDNTQISDDMAALPIDEVSETLDMADAFLPDDFVSEEEIAEDVPVSPFGFGPYPEVPEGWPADTFPAPSANHELLARVEIKLLSQGINTAGANMENGLVYPVIKGTAYVKWKSYLRPDGEITYISDIIAHPEDGARLNAIRAEKGRSLTETDVPSDIKLVSFEEGAIDPYQFLDLP